MKVTIEELLHESAFRYNKKLKAYKQKRNRISASQIDIMIALAMIAGGMEDPKEVVFI